MALPIPSVRALEECADFATAVQPFIGQLYDLPARVLAVATGNESFLKVYTETNPVVSGFAFSLALAVVVLIVSEINRNYSQVDRLWSILPALYIAHFDAWARLAGISSKRIDAALVFSVAWAIRLTYNYARKGGYKKGHEDYRWEIVRQNVPKFAFHLLNLTFISFIQSILLFLITTPVYTILLASTIQPNLTSFDVAFVATQFGLLLIESIADEQQWVYQNAKKHFLATNQVTRGFTQADLERGFISSGLFGYSRHPNFAAEQSIWFVLYQWSAYATLTLYHWAGIGASALILLFQASTVLTESITAAKYAEYPIYQKRVGMFLPKRLFPYKPLSEIGKGTGKGGPKIIKTSELAKKYGLKEEGKKQK